MKRTILLTLLVSVLVAACSPAESDDSVEVDETTSTVTVFRSPT
jgi:nitrous oxide reductase accessory protein NosL